jgi:hypothetical protein
MIEYRKENAAAALASQRLDPLGIGRAEDTDTPTSSK